MLMIVAGFSTARAEDDLLEKLSERCTAQEKRCEEAEQKAKADQERKKISESLQPMHALVGDFVAVEQSHRGKPVAISVLYQLMRNAAFVADPDIPASQGRVK